MNPISPRPYVIEEYTRTICPQCAENGIRSDDPNAFVDGMLVSHDGSVWLRRFCGIHGESESLYEENLEIWKSRFGWQTPTLSINPDRIGNNEGFPKGYAQGLPASHGQHSCVLVLNITENCNFKCPTCFASALEPGSPTVEHPTFDEILNTVDTVIEREGGKLSVLMLSGGEPTLRRDLEPLIVALKERNITRIMLNTNGRRIGKDATFLAFLNDHRDKVEVYLQFDGLKEEAYLHLRAEPLLEEKMAILEKLNASQIFTTLVVSVKKMVNEDQVKAVFELGLATPYCSGIAFQPVFGSGRNSGIDPINRATPTGVIHILEKNQDFVPLPCSHKDCCDIGYFLQDSKGNWRSAVSLFGREELKKWVHLVSNTIAFDNVQESVRSMLKDGSLVRLLSEQQRSSSLQTAMDLMKMCDCIPGVRDLLGGFWKQSPETKLEALATRTFRVTVKMFMDAHTFHEDRIRQCCVHVGTFEEDPRRYSFCWRWIFDDAPDIPKRVSTLKVL